MKKTFIVLLFGALMVNGLKYDEIATLLNKNLKQVDNTIQRVKNKIKKIIEKK